MVIGKRKGRSFERLYYKKFRDDGRFINVKLSLGSGSTDEPSDISFKFKDKTYVIECKKGSKLYCSETNLTKYWDKLTSRIEIEIPILLYQASYERCYVWVEINDIVCRILFDDFFNKYLI